MSGETRKFESCSMSWVAQRSSSTALMNIWIEWLKRAGSSRFMVWPVWGKTRSPEVGMLRFRKIEVSMQGASSSPTMMRVGTESWRH